MSDMGKVLKTILGPWLMGIGTLSHEWECGNMKFYGSLCGMKVPCKTLGNIDH